MNISNSSIENLVQLHYGLPVIVQSLNGYDEMNFLLRDEQGRKWILKLSDSTHDAAFIDAQIQILHHLSQTPLADKFQHLIRNKEGQTITQVQIGKDHFSMRILNFLDGTFWVDAPSHTPALLRSLGNFLGEMDVALSTFRHPAMHRHYEWDIQNTLDARGLLPYITDPEKRRIVAYFLLQFEAQVTPLLPSLRYAYIHNDANDYNILIHNEKLCGLIDFGDMVYAPLINNLAVACTYALFGQKNILAAAAEIIKAYNEKLPLDRTELETLYYLIAGRLCISVSRSAYQGNWSTGNEHHFVTEKNAWTLLFEWITINPIRAQRVFIDACGMNLDIGSPEKRAKLESARKKNIGGNLSLSYADHLTINRGALQYLYDDEGNTFIDCVNNVSHVGHCHPTVVQAMQKQIATLNTNTRYLNSNLVEYAQQLTATLPSALSVCYFVNSGSEANDLAIRMSRHFTKKEDVVVLDHAYHGTSTLAIEMSPYKFDGKGGFGQKAYIHKAISPDPYRGPFRYPDADVGPHYAQDVQRILKEVKKAGRGAAAFICETLLGVGGQIPLPPRYLENVYKYVRDEGGICIADEVQVGFGRVGETFWGFDLQNVTPDIVVMGKPIGNGHPMAAVVVTEAIANAFNNGMEYFNTYGGNPVSMVTGLAVLQVIREEGLQNHAKQVGSFLLEKLRNLYEKYTIIGDVRGIGLFIGVELVKDRATLEPALPEIDQIVEKMKARGFLLSTDGPLHNVLKIKPPIVFSTSNADQLVFHLDQVLDEISKGSR